MSWSRWNWLDDGVLPLAVTILRVCWLWPWLALLQRWLASSYQGTLLTVGLVFGLLFGGTIAARRALRLPSTWARAAVAGVGLAVIFVMLWWRLYWPQYPLWDPRWIRTWSTEMTDWSGWETQGVPTPFFALLAMAYLWLRGLLDGGRFSLMREHIWRTFAVGFLALAALLMAASLDGRGLPAGTVNLLWLFFATGMVALALAGLKAAGGLDGALESDGGQIAVRPGLDRYWLMSVFSIIGALLGLGLALSAVIAPEAVGQVLGAVWIVIRQAILYLWIIVSLILFPIAYVLALFLQPLLEALTRFGESVGLNELPALTESWEGQESPGEGLGMLDSLPDGLQWVALGALIVLIGLAFALALRRLLSGRKPKNGIVETRETILSRELLQKQMADLWRSLLGRFRRHQNTPFNPFLSLEGETPTRRVIRAVYQAVLAAAQERGWPRPRSFTPGEYRPDLEIVWPSGQAALGVITEGYVNARYGSNPPSTEQAECVRQAWDVLQTSLEAKS